MKKDLYQIASEFEQDLETACETYANAIRTNKIIRYEHLDFEYNHDICEYFEDISADVLRKICLKFGLNNDEREELKRIIIYELHLTEVITDYADQLSNDKELQAHIKSVKNRIQNLTKIILDEYNEKKLNHFLTTNQKNL